MIENNNNLRRGLTLYSDIAQREKLNKIENAIHLMEELGGNFDNRFKESIDYLYGYLQGSLAMENAIERGQWERSQNENNK